MRFHNFHLRGLGFRGAHFHGTPGFGSLPANPRQWVKDNIPQNTYEVDRLFTYGDGLNGGDPTGFQWIGALGKETFDSLYAKALVVSDHIDAVRDDPFAAALVQDEAGLSATITNALIKARTAYSYSGIWGRPGDQQQALWVAYGALGNGLRSYIALQSVVDDVGAQIAARQTTANAVAVQANITAIALSAKTAKIAQAVTAQAEGVRANYSADAAVAEKDEVAANRARDQALEAQIFGLPISTVLPIAGAGVLALLLLHRRPAGAAPTNGYRRRRRR